MSYSSPFSVPRSSFTRTCFRAADWIKAACSKNAAKRPRPRMRAPLPEDERARIENLREFHVLDTEPEQAFDDLTRLAAYISQTPTALITFVDSDRQWFKSRVGFDRRETPRDVSFCAHAILQPGPLVVKDALDD